VTFIAENDGSRPATTALVEIVVSGDFQINRVKAMTNQVRQVDDKRRLAELEIAMPPKPPSWADPVGLFLGRQFDPLEHAPPRMVDHFANLNRNRDADSFYWRSGRDGPTDRLELECENWRHQREAEKFTFSFLGRDESSIQGIVTGTLSATNMTVPIRARLIVRIAFEDQPLEPVAEQMVAEFERHSPLWRTANGVQSG